MANVVLDHVRKVYDDGFVAVHDATLDIRDGEFVVLVGPSGCGKSTTLRMIAGLETISAGTLSIGGRVVNDVAPKDRDIAMVFQNYALYPHMTVFDNMAFGLKLRKFPAPEVETRVRQAADTLGLTSVLDRKPKALSGGQRQRVALGRAIVRKPSVFLFDEPLSNLDAKLRVQTRTEIARLHRQLGATMVYVTHDQVEAMTMGDRIVVLKDGHIQQVAAPLELYDTPANAFVAGFIGSPSMNFIEGVVNEDRTFVAAREAFRFSLSNRADHLETGPVTLGVRPEDLYVDGVAPPSRTLSEPLAAVIENLEPMGNEVVLYARPGGGDTLVARVEPQELPSAGETAMLRIDVGAIHFFDSSSGVALTRRPARSAA